MTLGLLSGRGYTDSYTSLALSFVLGLPSLCSFAQAAVSAVRHALSAFDSMFPFLLPLFAGSFAGHYDNTIVPYRQPPKPHFKNTMSSISTTP